jgi:tripartite-type tricarboxylate transporter receptor subunit TctC
MRKSIGIAAALAVLSTLSGEVIAQTYPSRPITMIVPFAAGGPLDVMGRILGERMRASLGQPVIIETVPRPLAASESAGSRGRRPTATRSASATGRHTW